MKNISDNQKERIFINLSNHSSANWEQAQINAALAYGKIVDIPFPNIDPEISSYECDLIVEEYYKKILDFGSNVDITVMLQGEFIFTYRFVVLLKKNNIVAVAAKSKRCCEEQINPDGSVTKISKFKFVKFMEY